MIVKIYMLTLLLHIIDDFVLQPICLSKLKQKSWWEAQFTSEGDKEKYGRNYKTGLCIHALSWSTMILLPWFPYLENTEILTAAWIINWGIHYYIDDLKANKKKINLGLDQNIHILQIIITNLILTWSLYG